MVRSFSVRSTSLFAGVCLAASLNWSVVFGQTQAQKETGWKDKGSTVEQVKTTDRVGIGTSPTGRAKLHVKQPSSSSGAVAVLGQATASSGTTRGVEGTSNSSNGIGVKGDSPNVGVYGTGDNVGVQGIGTADSGGSVGVQGQTNSADGVGVRAINNDSTDADARIFDCMSSDGTEFSISTNGDGFLAGTLDLGGFMMATGAQNGFVLTSDGNGNGSWQAGSGWTDDGTVVRLNTDSDQVGVGISTPESNTKVHVVEAGTSGVAVLGAATSTSGTNFGVKGTNASAAGFGLFGENTADAGIGVKGESKASSGAGIGVIGTANSQAGVGVLGTGSGTGVVGSRTFGGGFAVFGRNTGDGGIGVQGDVNKGTAVKGIARASQGAFAVDGSCTDDPNGIAGVFETLSTGAGNAIGVRAGTNGSGGIGVQGESKAASGVGIGVKGESRATSGDGVFGFASATTGDAFGVRGVTESDQGVGVWGEGRDTNAIGIVANSTEPNTSRLLECRENGNVRFRVKGDGNVQADGPYSGAGADFAEILPVEGGIEKLEYGDVLALSANGKLTQAAARYDSAVVGVYSQKPTVLGDYLKLDDDGTETDEAFEARVQKEGPRVPVALMGVVYVKVCDENGSIQPGDLLTTSGTPGHAMKCTDKFQGMGAILGKALQPHGSGKGRIRMLLMQR